MTLFPHTSHAPVNLPPVKRLALNRAGQESDGNTTWVAVDNCVIGAMQVKCGTGAIVYKQFQFYGWFQ